MSAAHDSTLMIEQPVFFSDSLLHSRIEGSEGGDSEVQRTVLELLNQLDGFESSSNIKVLMATNRLDILDDALIRCGPSFSLMTFALVALHLLHSRLYLFFPHRVPNAVIISKK